MLGGSEFRRGVRSSVFGRMVGGGAFRRDVGGAGRRSAGVHGAAIFPCLVVRREELVDLGGGDHELVLEGGEEGALHVVGILSAQVARCCYPRVVEPFILVKLHCDYHAT
jgi:hypothetical protein